METDMDLPEFLIDHPDGEIRLTGHRISLYNIISLYQEGYTAAMLHEEFPSVPLPLIDQVIGFYRQNQPELDAYVAEQRSALERLEASIPPSPALLRLRRKLEEMQRGEEP
jgi:uncharacterized protein (DUF433 family)